MSDRLPFDPEKMKAALAVEAARQRGEGVGAALVSVSAKGETPLSVTQLAALIGQALSGAFPGTVRVVGEISNFNTRTHWYFALKDAGAVVNCVMFAGKVKGVGFVPENGQQVVLTGRVELYEPQGKLTLNVEKVEPVGAGALELAYRKLVAEIKALGWFEQERKRALPVFARRIAVITSAKGAALQDVRNTAGKRCPAVELCLVDVLVQGAGAAAQIARAIAWVSKHHERLGGEGGIGAVIVTRGGGSMEDLWAFNERVVAEAIVNCAIPVVAAIGHETDTTIAELVADERCATPTQAAMRLTPDRSALRQEMNATLKRLSLGMGRDLKTSRERLRTDGRRLAGDVRQLLSARGGHLARLATRLEKIKPTAIHQRRCTALAILEQRMRVAVRHRLTALGERLTSTGRQLDLVGPVAVLKRGYSVTMNAKGEVVRGPGDVRTGEVMTTRLAEGQIESTVGRSAAMPLPAARRRKKPEETGPGLFS